MSLVETNQAHLRVSAASQRARNNIQCRLLKQCSVNFLYFTMAAICPSARKKLLSSRLECIRNAPGKCTHLSSPACNHLSVLIPPFQFSAVGFRHLISGAMEILPRFRTRRSLRHGRCCRCHAQPPMSAARSSLHSVLLLVAVTAENIMFFESSQ